MNNYKITDDAVIFDCGCYFRRTGKTIEFNPDLHDPKHTINFACPATYKLLQEGLTEGVFQLGSPDGKAQCKKLVPTEMEHISALGAIVRPGCKQCLSADTKIAIKRYQREGRKFHTKKITIKELYDTFKRQHPNYTNHIVSYNEETQEFFDNKIVDVYYQGVQPTYKIQVRVRKYGQNDVKFYNLRCTQNHRFLVHRKGWLKLNELKYGDRIAVINNLERNKEPKTNKYIKGEKSFGNLCFYNYEYKCVCCNWQEASLDVNHLDGNRKTNNNINNLCFLCPNHHRMYHENKISKENIIEKRKKYTLKNTRHVYWVEYIGNEYFKHEDVYDIEVEGPHNNFIAGNFIVHNSKDSDGNNITVRYQRKKNGKMELTSFHPIVDKILEKTYGENIYQETSLELAKQCAGFSLSEADTLRKGIGKKVPEIISQCKKQFIEKGKELGIFSEEQLVEIFGWIEASQRYSFNHSHAWSYGLNGYVTAYQKAHFPVNFFKSWFQNEDKRENYTNFVNEAKIFNINVYPPDIRDFRSEFYIKKKHIYFGLTNIKGIVKKDIEKLNELFAEKNWSFSALGAEITWMDFLVQITDNISSSTTDVLIRSGALDCFRIDRAKMLYEYDRWASISNAEKQWYNKHESLINFIQYAISVYEERYSKNLEEYQDKVIKRENSSRKRTKEPKPIKEPKENQRLPKLRTILQELGSPIYNIQDTVDSVIFSEEDLLGVTLTRHKTDEVSNCAETATCKDILEGRKGYNVLRVKIDECRTHNCKNGTTMAFIKMSDKTGQISSVIFGKKDQNDKEGYQEYQHLLTKHSLVFVSGELGKDSFIIKRVYNVG